MTVPFTLEVPVADPFRELGPDVAGRYAELAGGSAADADALRAAVRDVLRAVGDPAGRDANVRLSFAVRGDEVEVTATCNGRSSTVRHVRAARQS